MDKNSFVLYKSFYQPVSVLTLEQKGKLFDAIFRYQIEGVEEVDDDIRMPFLFFLNQFRFDEQKYSDICAKRRESGKKGGAPKGNKNALKQNNQNKQMVEKQAKQAREPNGCLEESSPIPPKEEYIDSSLRSESIHTNNACASFHDWLSKECPYIFSHYKHLSDTEFDKLKLAYSSEAIAETCLNIENRLDLRKKYSNLYRTLLNWLKNGKATIQTAQRAYQGSDHPSNNEMVAGAAGLIAELAEKRRNGG